MVHCQCQCSGSGEPDCTSSSTVVMVLHSLAGCTPGPAPAATPSPSRTPSRSPRVSSGLLGALALAITMSGTGKLSEPCVGLRLLQDRVWNASDSLAADGLSLRLRRVGVGLSQWQTRRFGLAGGPGSASATGSDWELEACQWAIPVQWQLALSSGSFGMEATPSQDLPGCIFAGCGFELPVCFITPGCVAELGLPLPAHCTALHCTALPVTPPPSASASALVP
jgi:hypothetical protein